MMSAVEHLVLALQQANAPAEMIERATAGAYDDWLSESATPISDLVRDAELAGLPDIVRRAGSGEFDTT